MLKREPKPGGRLKIQVGSPPAAGTLIRGEVKGRINFLLNASKCQKLQLHLVVGCCTSTGGKVIQKKKQKMMGKLTSSCTALPQPSSSPQPNWPKNAVKNQSLLIIDTSMSILMRTLLLLDTQLVFRIWLYWNSGYRYSSGIELHKRIYFVVCWVLMEMRDLEAWHEADNICQGKFKGHGVWAESFTWIWKLNP